MRQLSKKEEEFLIENQIIKGVQYRRHLGRGNSETSVESEKVCERVVTAKYVREVCGQDLGDFVIDFEGTEQYLKDAQKRKEFLVKKRAAEKLGDTKLLKSLVSGITEDDDEDLDELRDEYIEVVGRKPHPSMKAAKMQKAIDKANESKED